MNTPSVSERCAVVDRLVADWQEANEEAAMADREFDGGEWSDAARDETLQRQIDQTCAELRVSREQYDAWCNEVDDEVMRQERQG
jgi:hypothetical protein